MAASRFRPFSGTDDVPKWLMALGLFSFMLLALAIAMFCRSMLKSEPDLMGRPALFSVDATVTDASRNAFLGEIRRFSEGNGFDMASSRLYNSDDFIFVSLHRKDIRISITNPFEKRVFRIDLFKLDERHFDAHVTAELTRSLMDALRRLEDVELSEDVATPTP